MGVSEKLISYATQRTDAAFCMELVFRWRNDDGQSTGNGLLGSTRMEYRGMHRYGTLSSAPLMSITITELIISTNRRAKRQSGLQANLRNLAKNSVPTNGITLAVKCRIT